MRPWMLLVLLSGACEYESRPVRGTFDPPEEPDHDKNEHGAMHARGMETPFLCVVPGNARRFEGCPDDVRPEQAQLSCDASGCHGDYTFEPGIDPASRHLRGSDGPSCFACHNREWDNQKTGTAREDD